MRCFVRLSSGRRLSPRKAFERRPFSLRTSGDVGRVRLKAVALVQESNVTCSFCFFFLRAGNRIAPLFQAFTG